MNKGEFFILCETTDDSGSISFKCGKVFNSFTDCVDFVKAELDGAVEARFGGEGDRKDVTVPTNEQIYESLYTDKYLCYILGEGSEEYRILFNVVKIRVGNTVETVEMNFCQN